jgi:hypothetical protein
MASSAGAGRIASTSTAALPGAYDRIFYSGMAIAMLMTVLAGFAPTYYMRFFSDAPWATLSGGPFTRLVHLHGALFTAWVVLFVVQTTLVAGRRVRLHRRLGVAGVVLAATMVAVGTLTAIVQATRGAAPDGVDPLSFLAVPLFDMLMFGSFVTAAVMQRRNREAHKRLMMLAYFSIITAAVARLPGVLALGPVGFFGLGFAFLVVAVLYDYASRGRVHPVYAWGGLLLVISVAARLAISGTSAWLAFARTLTASVGG